MLFREISRILGKYFFFFSFVLFIPLAVSLYYDFIEKTPHPHAYLSFIETIIISFALSLLFRFLGRGAKYHLRRREGILLVVLIWVFSAFVSALPFQLSKTLPNFIDAYFEAMSGYTTTGASVIAAKAYDSRGQEIPIYQTNIHVPNKTYVYYGTIPPVRDPSSGAILYTGVEAVSRGVLFWRSFIQWLGGMGIVVLFLAILPTLAIGGRFLYETEVPGPTKESLTPRIKETASILWKLYLGITIAQIFLLIWTNPSMPLFDVFCTTFSTISTGGFTVRNDSIGSYNNALTDWVVILFMLIGSINFGIYFHILRRRIYKIYDMDFLVFLLFILGGSLFVSFNILGFTQTLPDGSEITLSLGQALRYGFFQTISAQTSTGFTNINYDIWPFSSQVILLLWMFVGGMSGSTSGGIKTTRFYILFKIICDKIESIFRPEKIRHLRIGYKDINVKISTTVLVFFALAIFSAVIGTFGMIINGVDPETSLGVVGCVLNNVGYAFRAAGPDGSFAILPPMSKIISIFLMLLGRLEYFAVLLLFIPSFWKKT